MNLSPINIQDYTYDLPQERIADYPLAKRDESKLLVYNHGEITHHVFSQLPDILSNNSTLFFNDTKVIPARFFFEKDTGAIIEVFLLEPLSPSTLLSDALGTSHKTVWKCAVGNLKKWNESVPLKKVIGNITLEARLIDRQNGRVEFSWHPAELSFGEIVQAAGAMPLPPYIKRAADKTDIERYQTIYSNAEGAVAAPTAGLHFTDEVMENLHSRGIITDFVTLHVSAGTFLPVKAANAVDHNMHTEQIIISRSNIENMLIHGRQIIPIGTTAMRTLESTYWFGARLLREGNSPFTIEKLDPYHGKWGTPSTEDSLNAVLHYMKEMKVGRIAGQTSIFIFPGYKFNICKGIVTNFHQPASTLLLLIAALIGPKWKKVYDEAAKNRYRFLSYGDSSLLLP
ncbi:S-adenosylmethionine:tRNA ribosyltransferase-isomerase [soil metagenome]